MIYGFLDCKIVNAEAYLIDYSIRMGQSVHISTDLLNIPITFDGNDINAFILNNTNNKLVLQLILPIKEKFDDSSNCYKTSYIRKLLNSTEFLSRFNKEFIEHIKPTIVHTKDYTTEDKLWLLSHEEVDQSVSFLKTNNSCNSFDLFKNVNIEYYTRTLLNLNKQRCFAWWLRSACSDAYCVDYSSVVGYVAYNGDVSGSHATDIRYGALLPACTIC